LISVDIKNIYRYLHEYKYKYKMNIYPTSRILSHTLPTSTSVPNDDVRVNGKTDLYRTIQISSPHNL